MNDKQKLYPQKIYQVNYVLEEIRKICEIKDQLVGFSILNYFTQKFNNFPIHSDRWEFNGKICNNIIGCLKTKKHKDDWKYLFEHIESVGLEVLQESVDYFKKIMEEKCTLLTSEEEYKEFHYHLLNLYQSFPIDSNEYIDGIVFRNFKKKQTRLLYATGELLVEMGKTYNVYPWIDMTFVYESGEKIRSISCQEYGGKDCDMVYIADVTREKIKMTIKNKVSIKPSVYFDYLLPIFAGYLSPSGDATLKYDGKHKNTYLLSKSYIRNLLVKIKYILCIPVYNAYIDKRLYGSFYGIFTIPFTFKDDRDEFIKEHKKKIEENLFLLIK